MADQMIELSGFRMPYSLYTFVVFLAEKRGYEPLDPGQVIAFLDELIAKGFDATITDEERAELNEDVEAAFQQSREELMSLLSLPKEQRELPEGYYSIQAAKDWFRIYRRCPECGKYVESPRKGQLFCRQRCGQRFYAKAAALRRKREAAR